MWKSEAVHLNRCAGIWWTIGAPRLDFLCQYKVWIFRRFKQKTGSRVRFNEILVVSRPWAACLIFRRCIVSFGDRLLGILVCWTHTPIQLRSESHVRHVRSLVYSVDGIFDAEKDRLFRLPQLRQIALLLIERRGHFFRSGNVTLTLETIFTGAEHALFCLRVNLKFLWGGHVGPAVLLQSIFYLLDKLLALSKKCVFGIFVFQDTNWLVAVVQTFLFSRRTKHGELLGLDRKGFPRGPSYVNLPLVLLVRISREDFDWARSRLILGGNCSIWVKGKTTGIQVSNLESEHLLGRINWHILVDFYALLIWPYQGAQLALLSFRGFGLRCRFIVPSWGYWLGSIFLGLCSSYKRRLRRFMLDAWWRQI